MRIVSKSEYVARQLIHVALASGGCILAIVGLGALMLGVLALGVVAMVCMAMPASYVSVLALAVCLLFFLVAYVTIRYGAVMVIESGQMEPVRPWTRRTIAETPQKECLLRSSSETLDGADYLLRTETTDSGAELLRPGP
jgi:hypothetical protein